MGRHHAGQRERTEAADAYRKTHYSKLETGRPFKARCQSTLLHSIQLTTGLDFRLLPQPLKVETPNRLRTLHLAAPSFVWQRKNRQY